MRVMLKSKIHRAVVTKTDLNYEGSCAIDKRILQAADILPYEQIHILNVRNGERFVTYAIEGGPGEVCIKGAAARLCEEGDAVIILAYRHIDRLINYTGPRIVHLTTGNEVKR